MPQIKAEHLKKNYLTMSAAEMLFLTLYFGFLVGDLVPDSDDVWIFYTLTVQLLELLLSRVFNDDLLNFLNVLIQEHHSLFIKLFNENLRPKYHILLHYPKIIKLVGPPRFYWSMRFEGFHKLLKNTANSTTCRKNIILTLATKQQLRLSYRFTSKKGLKIEQKFGPPCLEVQSRKVFKTNCSKDAFCVPWVSINYNVYKRGLFLCIDNKADNTDGCVSFAQIKNIVNDKGSIFFLLVKYVTIGFAFHYQAYEVKTALSNKVFILFLCFFKR